MYDNQIDGLTGRKYSYNVVRRLATQLASALRMRGLKKNDVLCVILPNSVELALTLLAVPALGAIVTTINPASTAGKATT